MIYFWGVLALGFIAAVGLGSVAWYNSKKPAGWEDVEAPGWANQTWAQAPDEQTSNVDSVQPLNTEPRVN